MGRRGTSGYRSGIVLGRWKMRPGHGGVKEGKKLETEITSGGEGEKGKEGFWKWYTGQYTGTRTFG